MNSAWLHEPFTIIKSTEDPVFYKGYKEQYNLMMLDCTNEANDCY